jgi:hypothetical protein
VRATDTWATVFGFVFVADWSLERRRLCVDSTYDQPRSGHKLRQ